MDILLMFIIIVRIKIRRVRKIQYFVYNNSEVKHVILPSGGSHISGLYRYLENRFCSDTRTTGFQIPRKMATESAVMFYAVAIKTK